MNDDYTAFKDYAYRGIDGLLRLTARAGDSLRVASNRAIEKLDTLQLERKLERLLKKLGQHAYERLAVSPSLSLEESSTMNLFLEIETVTGELKRRSSTEPFATEKETNTKNNS